MLVFKKMGQRISDHAMNEITHICLDPDIKWFSPNDVIYEKYVNHSDDTIYFLKSKRIQEILKGQMTSEHFYIPNALVSKTPKGCMQPPHKDKSRDYSFYIPIYPNMYDYSPMTFYHNNELHHIDNLDPGSVYLVNHKVMHSAFNFTDYDRFNIQITILDKWHLIKCLKEEDALPLI